MDAGWSLDGFGQTEVRLAAEKAAPKRAREAVSTALGGAGIDTGVTDVAVLLVSELVTNAVVHADSPSVVRLARLPDPDRLRLEVDDDSSEVPVQQAPNWQRNGGRGLMLLDRLSSAWGADRRADGKTVWFELPLANG